MSTATFEIVLTGIALVLLVLLPIVFCVTMAKHRALAEQSPMGPAGDH